MANAAEVNVLFTTEGAKEVIKATDDIAKKMGVLSDDFKKQNPIITQNVETWGELEHKLKGGSKATKAVAKSAEDAAGKLKKAGKASGGFSTQLKGMAKGLIGVASTYAAGRWIISFTKETLKAAEAAGKLPPIFAESERTTKKLKETMGEYAGQELEDTIVKTNELKEAYIAQVEARIMLNHAEEEGIITGREANQISREAALFGRDVTVVIDKYEDQLRETMKAQRDFNSELKDLQFMVGFDFSVKRESAQGKLGGLEKTKDELIGEIADLQDIAPFEMSAADTKRLEQLEKRKGLTKELKIELKELQTIQSMVGSQTLTKGQQEELEGLQDELANTRIGIQETQDAWDRQTKQMLFDLTLQSLALDTMNKEDLPEALRLVAMLAGPEGWGLFTEEEANVIDSIGNVTTALTMEGDQSQYAFDMLMKLGEADQLLIEGQPPLQKAVEGTAQAFGLWRNRASGAAAQTLRALEAGEDIHGRVFTATFITHNVETFATRGGIGQGKNFKKGLDTDAGGATGLSGIVPPGFPGDSFTIGATSGESVDIKTKAQQGQGSGIGELSSMLGGKIDEMGDRIIQALAMNS